MTGLELITAERQRQVEVEGWSAAHDDEHSHGEMRYAAQCYLAWSFSKHESAPPGWPWEGRFWKQSSDAIRNLVKAGALIAAEIDRLQRCCLNPQCAAEDETQHYSESEDE